MVIENLAATSSKSGGSSFSYILIIVVIFAAFYFLMIRPQQRRRQQAAQQQNTVSPGARVRTTAGMYATVVAVDGDDVVLEVAPGIEVRYMKRAIMDVVSPGDAVDDTYATDAEAEEPGQEPADDVHDEAAGTAEQAGSHETGHDSEETAYEKATGFNKD